MRDPYEILGIAPGSTPADIQRAFRRAAMEWHPDRNPHPEATARFREAVEAYECLKDPARRAAYDAGRPRQRSEPPPRADEPPPEPSELDRFLAEANDSLRITPETLVAFFARVEALLRKAFA